jgi:diguanylate cyclase (GGDEF)-like protein
VFCYFQSMAWVQSLRHRFWPVVPAEVRDELAALRYERLVQQLPAVYLTIIAVVLTAMLAADQSSPWIVRYAIPVPVVIAAAYRLQWWLRQRGQAIEPDAARQQIVRTAALSAGICAVCSVWCIASWQMAAPEQRSYYPMFMAIGSLITAFSVSSIRLVTFANLTGGIVPIAIALLFFGTDLDRVAAMFVAVATLFLVRMVNDQHAQLVDLLMLKHQLREQAHSDPLTGLCNRRALIAEAEAAFAAPGARPALALIDLDGFKAVNDRLGHAAGDALLIQIAERMRAAAGAAATVARLGGDEFALLLGDGDAATLAAQTDRLLGALVPAFPIGEEVVSLGACAGMACAPQDGTSLTSLFATADKALYAAKAARRGNSTKRPATRAVA